MQTGKMTVQYRAHVTTPDSTFSITSESEANIKRDIQLVLQGGCKFDETDPSTILVFHPRWNKGQTPLGYITQQTVPLELSVRQLTETRAAQAA